MDSKEAQERRSEIGIQRAAKRIRDEQAAEEAVAKEDVDIMESILDARGGRAEARASN